MPRSSSLYRVCLPLPPEFSCEALQGLEEDAWSETVLAFTCRLTGPRQDERWVAEWLTDGTPDTGRLAAVLAALGLAADPAAFESEAVPETDWLERCYRENPPLSIGPFYIYGSHCTPEPPPGAIPLLIDAVTAFGSGYHGTTAGCLEAMARLKGQGFSPRRVLDMGAGSGILALGAWRLWGAPVLAADNDPESLRVIERYRGANGVPGGAEGVSCALSEGFSSDTVRDEGPYDLILANILAEPLIEMAEGLAQALSPEGRAILSGLLDTQIDRIAEAYSLHGLRAGDTGIREGWATLVLRKG